MPRPSLKEEKREIILEAYEKCAARYGVEGATLQRVADMADMARPLLRHYVGNREDLLRECSGNMVVRSEREFAQMLAIDTPEMLIDSLFVTGEDDQDQIAIAWALILAAPNYDFVRADMNRWLSSFQGAFMQILQLLYPDNGQEKIKVVAIGLIGICSNYHTMKELADGAFLQQSYEAAKLLLSQLEEEKTK